MKRIVGLLSGAVLVFTGAVSAASISTIDMAPGLAGANLKNLATERKIRYALMVSYPVGLTAQPTILDTATGNIGLKCGVDKQCRSPFSFRGKEEQQQLNDTLQQATSDYVATVYPAEAPVAADQPKIYFGDIYTTVLWRAGNEQCLTLYSLTLDHEWESCEKIGKNSATLRNASTVNIESAITKQGAAHIMLLNQGLVGDATLVDVKSGSIISDCGEIKCKVSSTPIALQTKKIRQSGKKESVQVLAEDGYVVLVSKGSTCTTLFSYISGREFEICSPPYPKFWRP